jgi:hypothetical protein
MRPAVCARVTSNIPPRAVVLQSISPRLQSREIGWVSGHDTVGSRAGADIELLVGIVAGTAIEGNGDDAISRRRGGIHRWRGFLGATCHRAFSWSASSGEHITYDGGTLGELFQPSLLQKRTREGRKEKKSLGLYQTYHRPPRNHNLRVRTFRRILRNDPLPVRDAVHDGLAAVVAIVLLDRFVLDICDPAARDAPANSRGDGSLHARVCLSVAYGCEDLDLVALRRREGSGYEEGEE